MTKVQGAILGVVCLICGLVGSLAINSRTACADVTPIGKYQIVGAATVTMGPDGAPIRQSDLYRLDTQTGQVDVFYGVGQRDGTMKYGWKPAAR